MAHKDHKRVLLALGYYDSHLHQGVAGYARQAGWLLDTSMAYHGSIPHNWHGDGIITLLFPHQKKLVRYIRDSKVATVTLNADQMPSYPGVRLNHHRAGRIVADYFIEQGLNNLAFFKCSDVADIRGRIQGFEERASQAAANYHLIDYHKQQSQTPDPQAAGRWLLEQLKKMPLPAGIVAQSDKRAPILLAACEKAGLKVPQDIQIVGVDNDELACQSCWPPLTSLDTNRVALAWEGAALLEKLMSGRTAPDQAPVINPLGIVNRKSSGNAVINNPAVARAISFIDENFCKPIDAEKVAQAVSMSRCTFFSAFKETTGHSPAKAIRHRRIQKACNLLINSTEKLYVIAEKCGFSGHEHFTRSFTRACGQTPSEYRKIHNRTI